MEDTGAWDSRPMPVGQCHSIPLSTALKIAHLSQIPAPMEPLGRNKNTKSNETKTQNRTKRNTKCTLFGPQFHRL